MEQKCCRKENSYKILLHCALFFSLKYSLVFKIILFYFLSINFSLTSSDLLSQCAFVQICFSACIEWSVVWDLSFRSRGCVQDANIYTRIEWEWERMGMGTNLEQEPIGEEHGWSGVGEATGRREVVREERRRKCTDVHREY